MKNKVLTNFLSKWSISTSLGCPDTHLAESLRLAKLTYYSYMGAKKASNGEVGILVCKSLEEDMCHEGRTYSGLAISKLESRSNDLRLSPGQGPCSLALCWLRQGLSPTRSSKSNLTELTTRCTSPTSVVSGVDMCMCQNFTGSWTKGHCRRFTF